MFSAHHLLKAPRARVILLKKRLKHIDSSFPLSRVAGAGGSSLFPAEVLLLTVVGTAGALLSSPSSHTSRTHYSVGTVRCETTSDCDDKQLFQVQAALELKSEMQKVRLAQIVHDLHALAIEEAEKGKPGLIRRFVLMFTSNSSESSSNNSTSISSHAQTSEISLDGVNLSKLTPELASKLIQDIQDGAILDAKSLSALVDAVSQLLLKEPTLLDLRGKADAVTIVGDLHGSLSCLSSVLRLSSFGGSKMVIFDGDFVDRGVDSVEVICTLLLLKLAHPHHVFLLRGNHEDSLVAAVYGFQDELRKKYGSNFEERLWDDFSALFGALPIAAQTDTALILHGGIPSVDFDLNNLAKISAKERSKIWTAIEPKTPGEKIISEVLWSDPNSKIQGIRENSRGIGKFFGADVAENVLKRHNLKFLVRGHEVAEKGITSMSCGQGREVITVFSSANYPNGEGSNLGAVLTLDSKGSYQSEAFSYHAKVFKEKRVDPVGIIQSLIKTNKSKLEKAFYSVSSSRQVSIAQWSKVMAESLDLPDLEWASLQPALAPDRKDSMIDWKSFLNRHAVRVGSGDNSHAVEADQVEILHETHEMLVTVFKYLDVDHSGAIEMDEFRTGVAVLNKRLPRDRQLKDIEALFRTLDLDGSGAIDMKEFEQLFTVL